jgi:hypothetical protein
MGGWAAAADRRHMPVSLASSWTCLVPFCWLRVCRFFFISGEKLNCSLTCLLYVEGSGLRAVVLVEPTAGGSGDGAMHEGSGGSLILRVP